MTDRILLIKAKGGLGNRMLATACGLVYADLAGRTPVIDWRDGQYAPMGVDAYPLIFDPPEGEPGMLPPEAVEGLEPVTPTVWQGRLARQPVDLIEEQDPTKHTSQLVYRKYCVDLSRADQTEPVAVFWSYLPKFGRLRRLLRRHPKYRGRSERDILREVVGRWFRPNQRVRRELDALFSRLAPPVIGVHVRYSDLKVPLEPIEAALASRRAAEPAAPIYLATDNADVQERIRAGFEGVHTIDKWLPSEGERLHGNTGAADMVREAENALIDLWALARCDRLIFSSKSTFSATSAMIGGFAPADLTDIDGRSVKLRVKRLLQSYI